MKKRILFILSALIILFISSNSFITVNNNDAQLTGAWQSKDGAEERLLIIKDGYFTYTVYNVADKQFRMTTGGKYKANGNLTITTEFDTENKDRIGRTDVVGFTLNDNQLTIDYENNKETFTKVDDGKSALAGVWHITDRMQNGSLTPIQHTGTRKTLKILSNTRFQWVAIDPGSKEFFGTGGGTYTFSDGKYTENIEFFSRDNSRVGASLTFNGKLENGKWHHSGLSSKGDAIYEVWQKVK